MNVSFQLVAMFLVCRSFCHQIWKPEKLNCRFTEKPKKIFSHLSPMVSSHAGSCAYDWGICAQEFCLPLQYNEGEWNFGKKEINSTVSFQKQCSGQFLVWKTVSDKNCSHKLCGLSRVTMSLFLKRKNVAVELFKCQFWCFEHHKQNSISPKSRNLKGVYL